MKTQEAQVKAAHSAYLPTINATSSINRTNSNTVVNEVPTLSSHLNTSTRSSSLSLNWTLFDFRLRGSKSDNARQLLAAAIATQDAALQDIFLSAAQNYYVALNAQAVLEAAIDSEKSAKENFMAADAKYKAGVGTLADKLQVHTTYAQTTLDRVKAAGEVSNSRGVLAITMGLNANENFTLAHDDHALPNSDFIQSVDRLIEDAKHHHPGLRAAQARLEAARANVRMVQAEGMPTISMVGGISRNDPSSGFPALSSYSRDKNIGVQVSIPLFEGFGRKHQVEAAKGDI